MPVTNDIRHGQLRKPWSSRGASRPEGWNIEFKKDDKGKVTGAVWTGKIAPYEFVEFGMLGINPKEGSNLVWKFVQYYEDGSKEEFTGPAGSFRPSPVVTLKKAGH